MNAATEPNPPNLDARELARLGNLARVARQLTGADLRSLRADVYRIVTPVVFQNHTRRLEIARRHFHCARSFQSLGPECLDRFHDDLESVIDYLLRHAIGRISNLEGWVTRRLQAATVDGYRRRRGALGALQRPRLPGWLVSELGSDPRLMALALQMLEWVGVDRTAGMSRWPLEAWGDQRASRIGDHHSARRAVADDVGRVISAMRSRPYWYEKFVERPMGRKQAPVAVRSYPDFTMSEPASTVLAAHYDMVDAHILDLVAVAMEAIERRIGQREDPRTVVSDVLTIAFTTCIGAADLEERPGSGAELSEAFARRLADPDTLDRIVVVVLELLALKIL